VPPRDRKVQLEIVEELDRGIGVRKPVQETGSRRNVLTVAMFRYYGAPHGLIGCCIALYRR